MTVTTSPQPKVAPLANHRPLNGDRWVDLFGSTVSGVLRDVDGQSWRVTADGSSTTVPVGSPGDLYALQGHLVEQTEQEQAALGTLGQQPTAGQARTDLIALHLDMTGEPIASVVVVTGTPYATGSAALRPLPTQSATIWQEPLAYVTRRGTSAVEQTDITDLRAWAGTNRNLAGEANPEAWTLYVGDTWRRATFTYHREWDVESSTVVDRTVRSFELGKTQSWSWSDVPAYNWTTVAATFTVAPGSERTFPVIAGHEYRIESFLNVDTADTVERLCRVSVWAGGTLVAERPDLLLVESLKRVPVSVSGVWTATTTGNVTFSTRLAVKGSIRINTSFQSPTSILTHQGYRKA